VAAAAALVAASVQAVVPDQALPAAAAVVSPLVLAFLGDLEAVSVGDLHLVLGQDPVLERARARARVRVDGKSGFALI
jgi:hypothetical protein